jgi:hypothetical protein
VEIPVKTNSKGEKVRKESKKKAVPPLFLHAQIAQREGLGCRV